MEFPVSHQRALGALLLCSAAAFLINGEKPSGSFATWVACVRFIVLVGSGITLLLQKPLMPLKNPRTDADAMRQVYEAQAGPEAEFLGPLTSRLRLPEYKTLLNLY